VNKYGVAMASGRIAIRNPSYCSKPLPCRIQPRCRRSLGTGNADARDAVAPGEGARLIYRAIDDEKAAIGTLRVRISPRFVLPQRRVPKDSVLSCEAQWPQVAHRLMRSSAQKAR
jgi:hypothetical protein